MKHSIRICLSKFVLLLFSCWGSQPCSAQVAKTWRIVSTLDAQEAKQAAACDANFFYAIDNTRIAQYDRKTGVRLRVSQGEAKHLNSGFLFHGKLLCAHSNYPALPERSEIKVLDPKSMQLTNFKNFGSYGGSLTWVVRKDNVWWCNFAHYGSDNHKTFLACFDENWQEQKRWLYPADLLSQLGRFSLSGGIWLGNELLVTGHDAQELYRLRVPSQGKMLDYRGKVRVPFTGQGIAADPTDSSGRRLIGISRAKRQLILAELDVAESN